ncbi:MAG TPA: FmdB family zinc ribbon protein [Ideonella sp.]|jgi:putative FmdB family regulatory protein|nr:FmdB family zinc ribbon protein [Ideonella sp.]
MPIYAYRCADCGHTKDVLQKLSDPVLTTCPSCGAQAFQKQLTAAGFQLKGSGWYATDFKGGTSNDASKPVPAGESSATAAAPAASSSPASAPATPAAGCGSSCACH